MMDETAVIQEDVRAVLVALGLGDHARPISPHMVVHREIVPAIERLRAERDHWEAEHAGAFRALQATLESSLERQARLDAVEALCDRWTVHNENKTYAPMVVLQRSQIDAALRGDDG